VATLRAVPIRLRMQVAAAPWAAVVDELLYGAALSPAAGGRSHGPRPAPPTQPPVTPGLAHRFKPVDRGPLVTRGTGLSEP
jgi:hypothetical protein